MEDQEYFALQSAFTRMMMEARFMHFRYDIIFSFVSLCPKKIMLCFKKKQADLMFIMCGTVIVRKI